MSDQNSVGPADPLEELTRNKVYPVRVYGNSSKRRSNEREIHLPTRVGIRGIHSISCDDNRSYNKPEDDATTRELLVYQLLLEICEVDGVAEVRSDGYEIKIEFGEVFDPDLIMPIILELVITRLGYKRVQFSVWIDSVQLWRGKVRTTPPYTLEIPGVEIDTEPAEPDHDIDPSAGYRLIISQGGTSHWIKAELSAEAVEMLLNQDIGPAVVAGIIRPTENTDDLILESIDRSF